MPSRPPVPTDPTPGAKAQEERAGDRIAKLLARAGVASRREVERMIAEGRVARDGVAIDTPATVLRSLHGVTVDGQPVAAPPPARLFAYHKPAGLLVTERDPAGRPTIYDRLPAGLPRVVPVGRLDLATEGLLLLTTDGGLKRQLELPATGVERTYRARAYGPVSQAQLEELIDGVEIDGIRYGSIDANLERRTGANTWIEMTLTEGKNREVRRVLEHLGLQVGRLIRTRYGPFVLGDMPPGAVGEVRQHDLVAFRQSLKGKAGGDKDMRVMAAPLAEATAHQADNATSKPTPVPTPPRVEAAARNGSAKASDAGTGGTRRQAPGAQQNRPSRTGTAERSVGNRSGGDHDAASRQRNRTDLPAAISRPSRTRPNEGGDAHAASRRRPSLAKAPARVGSGHPDKGKAGAVAKSPRSKPADDAPRASSGRDSTPDQPARPPRPARKAGWARPKPRPAPRGKR